MQGRVMADRSGLGFLGFIFGGLTAAVMLVAVTVVIGPCRWPPDARRADPDRFDPIAASTQYAVKKMAPVFGAIFTFAWQAADQSLRAAGVCGDCDFHCTRLSPMIFIEVIAA